MESKTLTNAYIRLPGENKLTLVPICGQIFLAEEIYYSPDEYAKIRIIKYFLSIKNGKAYYIRDTEKNRKKHNYHKHGIIVNIP